MDILHCILFSSRTDLSKWLWYGCTCLFIDLWWEDSYKSIFILSFLIFNRIHFLLSTLRSLSSFPRIFLICFIFLDFDFIYKCPLSRILFYFYCIGFNWNHGYGLFLFLLPFFCSMRLIGSYHLLSISIGYLSLLFKDTHARSR